MDVGVDDLADGEGYHGGLGDAGLGLGDDVPARDDGDDDPLLDGGGFLEAVAQCCDALLLCPLDDGTA